MITPHDVGEQLQSYIAITMGWIDHYDLMHFGAAVLLIARLICDVPPAYQYLKSKFIKGKNS
ncbi:MAG TPA: hypothetical protein VNZ45_03065 [Bacteroidia bacterium]|jgi:hypothetical protein|nr:hypothetical protein [Bacteroidia bacterium]